MDIYCPTCGEPWDSYHLLYDEIHEADQLLEFIRKDFTRSGGRLCASTRPALEAMGWRFAGDTILSFTSCPSCKPERVLPDAAQRQEERAVIASMMECDLDGMIAMLAD